jgi:hypothetical protein
MSAHDSAGTHDGGSTIEEGGVHDVDFEEGRVGAMEPVKMNTLDSNPEFSPVVARGILGALETHLSPTL